jgi:hypothetical protein
VGQGLCAGHAPSGGTSPVRRGDDEAVASDSSVATTRSRGRRRRSEGSCDIGEERGG